MSEQDVAGVQRLPALHVRASSTIRRAIRSLRERLDKIDAAHGTQGNRIFYLATPPELFKMITAQLGDASLNQRRDDKCFVRLVIEKPFGVDLADRASS